MRNLLLLVTVLSTGCVGKAPPGGNTPEVDSGVDDAPPAIAGHAISGKTMDYFVLAQALEAATVTTDGIDPPKQATSIAGGSYALEDVPTGSKVYLTVARTNYRTTRNVATSMADVPLTQDVYVLSNADVTRQYVTVGKMPTAGKAFLAAELRNVAGAPLVGIPLANIVLLDANNVPVPGISGPYFFGAQGDINPALLVSEVAGGRSRVAILDVPPGNFQLKVTYPDAVGGIATSISQISSAADGAVLAIAGGPVTGGSPNNALFSTDIYPRLQTAAKGGTGCANCHTAGGVGAVLILDAPVATTLANLTAQPGVINLLAPATSLLLTKPLYEPPPALQNHPNATFLDPNDPDYKLVLRWITNGAPP